MCQAQYQWQLASLHDVFELATHIGTGFAA